MLFDSWVANLLAVVAVLLALFYYYIVSSDDYWKKKNVPYLSPSASIKDTIKILAGKMTSQQFMDNVYNTFKENGYGAMSGGNNPTILVCKPELMKHFMTKDFTSFHDRGLPYDEKNNPFSANLVTLSGQRWKDLRGKLSPTFTSGRIKWMFPLMQECTQELKEYIEMEIKKNDSIEIGELLIRYTTDVIGSCAFGVNCNSIQNPNEEFYVMSRESSTRSRQASIGRTLYSIAVAIFPKLQRFSASRERQRSSKLTTFFTELMDHTIKYRKENNVERNDFVQLMMKIMEEDSGEMKFNKEVMTTQAFLFFLAGLDNMASNVGFCLHALVVDQELQERVHHEISTVLEDYEGKMCYDVLNKMDLLSRVIDEGLRMYSPIPAHMRKQTDAKYIIPGTDIELEKGTTVTIPVQSLHHDEEFFPNPKRFDPDRFTEEETAKRHPYAYTPFGEGPRMCIAARFAKVLMRLTLAELVRNFNFSAGPKTDIVMELDPKVLLPSPKNNFWFRVTVR